MKPRPFLCGLALCICTLCLAQTKHYVKQASAGTGTGLGSWANAAGAAQLQGIIAAAASGDTIWIAGGLYHPTTYPAGSTGTSTRDYAFSLTNGVAIYGGFAGTETLLSQRNLAAGYVTSLSGDIGTVGNTTDNCYHVVVTLGATNTTILDGCKIDSGNANGPNTVTIWGQGFSEGNGGGIYFYQSAPALSNCTVTANLTSGLGGGAYFYQSGSMPFKNCTFSYNQATGGGGGIYKLNATPFHFYNCSFSNNQTSVNTGVTGGGAISSYQGGNTDSIVSCTFSLNSSSNYGGAVLYNQTGSPVIANSTLTQNNAGTYGGGLADYGGSSFTVQYCNFNNNAAPMGGGMYYQEGTSYFITDTFANNTANSTTGAGGGGLFIDVGANPKVSHCLFLGNVTSGSNGGGEYDKGSAQWDSSCVFFANIAKGTGSNGGGVYHETGGTATFWNCVFANDSCTGNGGGYNNDGSNTTLESCTFYNNGATANGGAIYDLGGADDPKYYNLMIWNNRPNNFYVSGAYTGFKIRYSDFPEAASFTGGSIANNIAVAPLFYDAGQVTGPDGKWADWDDGLHLSPYSAGVDAVPPNGTNGSVGYPTDDITGVLRPDNPTTSTYADMGAYEDGLFPLALNLIQFNAAPTPEGNIALSWQVGGVGDISAYRVNRSTDGSTFLRIATVQPVTDQDSYQYTDTSVTGDILYYRLQMVFADSTQQYSAVLEVTNPAGLGPVQVRPNLVEQSSTILFVGHVKTPFTVQARAIDVRGNVHLEQPVSLIAGDNAYPLDLQGLPRGAYYLILTGANGWRRVLPFIKE